jgi:hypothetical protein
LGCGRNPVSGRAEASSGRAAVDGMIGTRGLPPSGGVEGEDGGPECEASQ